jgi:hypothetical protein
MAAFRCTCGEHLLLANNGKVICWFCRNEFDTRALRPVEFEKTAAMPVIKRPDIPLRTSGNSRMGRD